MGEGPHGEARPLHTDDCQGQRPRDSGVWRHSAGAGGPVTCGSPADAEDAPGLCSQQLPGQDEETGISQWPDSFWESQSEQGLCVGRPRLTQAGHLGAGPARCLV